MSRCNNDDKKKCNWLIWMIVGIIMIATLSVGLEVGDDSECPNGYSLVTVNDIWACLQVDDIITYYNVTTINNVTQYNTSIINATGTIYGKTIKLSPDSDSSNNEINGGSFNLDCSLDSGSCITGYTSLGSRASGNYLSLFASNRSYDQNLLRVKSNGSADAMFIFHLGNGSNANALDISSLNQFDSALGVAGRELTKGTIKVTHNGNNNTDNSSSALSLALDGTQTLSKFIFGKSENGTRGDMLHFVNNDSNADQVFITWDARLGLNTRPLSMLDVQSSGLNTEVIRWLATDGSELGRFVESGGGHCYNEFFDASNNADWRFRCDGGDSFYNGGEFGIGTTSPTSKLHVIGDANITGNLYTGGNIITNSITYPISLELYDPEPARGSESNMHGGIIKIINNAYLDSNNNITFNKGSGKVLVVATNCTDEIGTIRINGDYIDRNTGERVNNYIDNLTMNKNSTDLTYNDGNSNEVHYIQYGYLSNYWFTDSVTVYTNDLDCPEVDTYHVSFEQFNDKNGVILNTFDVNLLATNINAEFDAYLYTIKKNGGSDVNVTPIRNLSIGTNGLNVTANRYYRLRKGQINESINGTKDGVWVDIHYSNSPAYIEDVTVKIWGEQSITNI